MHGIIRNIRHLVSRTNSKTWGEGSWEKVVVCIVADGRKKCNEKVYQYLAAMGVYQEGIAKREVNGKEVTAHIYEVSILLIQEMFFFFCKTGPNMSDLTIAAFPMALSTPHK
jgi:chitin synthase